MQIFIENEFIFWISKYTLVPPYLTVKFPNNKNDVGKQLFQCCSRVAFLLHFRKAVELSTDSSLLTVQCRMGCVFRSAKTKSLYQVHLLPTKQYQKILIVERCKNCSTFKVSVRSPVKFHYRLLKVPYLRLQFRTCTDIWNIIISVYVLPAAFR